jgi:hypothetical protein
MELGQRHIHISRKTKKLLLIIIPVIAVLGVALLVWRPWYTPKPYTMPGPWMRILYSHGELQQKQKWADSGKRMDSLDPQKALSLFMATDDPDISFDLLTQNQDLRADTVQSIQDLGKDPKNGDRLFLATFSTRQEDVVVFRLRQLVGTGPTKIWSVIGYLITSSSSSRASYSTTWQESDGPFISGQ